MPYRAIIILVVALLIGGVAEAQENKPEKWYWAWRESTKELLAYTADGQVNTILKDVPIDQIWLGEGNTAVALMLDDEQFGFYVLNSTEAIPIKADFDTNVKHDKFGLRFFLKSQNGFYFIIDTSELNQAILIDYDRKQAKLINPENGYYFIFSEDGQIIRFATSNRIYSVTHEEWGLWELALDTGNERLIYDHANPFPTAKYFRVDCNPNTKADQWLCRSYTEFDKSFRYDYRLVNLDGTTQSIIENSTSRIQWNVLLAGDSLVIIDETCTRECNIEVYAKGEREPILFPIPHDYLPLYQHFHAAYVEIINNSLLLQNNDILQLSQDGAIRELGTFFCCETVNTLSPDNKWIVLMNTKTGKTQVWNLEEDRVKFEYPLAEMVTAVDYFDRGFAITHLYSPQSWVYLYSTEKPVEIIGDVAAFVIDILPDDTLLIEDNFDQGKNKVGIYRYNPITNQYRLLVAEAVD